MLFWFWFCYFVWSGQNVVRYSSRLERIFYVLIVLFLWVKTFRKQILMLFWFRYFVWEHENKISQEANSEPLYANIPASGPNNSSESPVTTNTLLKSQNGWLLNFQKSGPNSPPLPETMPPPSWGAQGTRDVSSSLSGFFVSTSKMKWKGVEGPQLTDNPGLARNNHRSAKLGSHICKRWTGPISYLLRQRYFALERCEVQIKVLDCASLSVEILQVARGAGDRSSTLPVQVPFPNIFFCSKDLVLIFLDAHFFGHRAIE